MKFLFGQKTRLFGRVDGINKGVIHGWLAGQTKVSEGVSVYVNGRLIAKVPANLFRPDLAQANIEEGYNGFEINLKEFADKIDNQATEILIKPVEDQKSILAKKHFALPMSEDIKNESLFFLNSIYANKVMTPQLKSQELVVTDISDLILYLKTNETVTGIQRVVLHTLESALLTSITADKKLFRSVFSVSYLTKTSSSDIHLLSFSALSGLVKELSFEVERERLNTVIDTLEITAVSYALKGGDRFYIPGAYWIVPGIINKLRLMRAEENYTGKIHVTSFIHDIIPITHQQWIPHHAISDVIGQAAEVIRLSDCFITNSNFVKNELDVLCKLEMSKNISSKSVLLPHEVNMNVNTQSQRDFLQELGEYVLVVGTIEGRKNHILLYQIWANLIKKHGINEVPTLVVCGRWGWNVSIFQEACIKSSYLNGKIRILSGVSDPDLAQLYKQCLFTIFPSFVEGWGLPVGESLYFGKIAIASSASAIPEVGGQFAEYIDPYDLGSSFETVEQLLYNREHLSVKSTNIKKNFKPRLWQDFVDNIYSAIDDFSNVHTYQKFVIENNKVYSFGNHILYEKKYINWIDRGITDSLGADWFIGENLVPRSTSKEAILEFNTTATSDVDVLMLEIQLFSLLLPAERGLCNLNVRFNDEEISFQRRYNQLTWVSINLKRSDELPNIYFINRAYGGTEQIAIELHRMVLIKDGQNMDFNQIETILNSRL